ncbi:hypothetical protein BUALT_Bualt08G0134300 [Buddleja alternifolia]|uniref:EDRF1 N-terminal domain-containing protein n=1 Tax=Buddleja alternifolia TaxID=168488 RepID=A0AAV6X7A7_9LAMI|nr:hypothetical protein BUALT_Bualt08G0134300 [Buddleja alternifolia]
MEKRGSSSGELQCVGKLEIASPKPVGFLCGSIPVTTDEAFHDFTSAALVPSPHTVQAPRYRMIPTETDLNSLPLLSSIPEKVLPVADAQSRASGESPWEGDPVMSNLARKGEALAVSGLVEYGDEIDVIAPADILKQIFKIPYSKARVSVAVRRVGQTLILNSGPDIEEGERLIRRQNRQPKCVDQSLFLNFAMHSVRMEACDCPPSHSSSSDEQFRSSFYPNRYTSTEGSLQSSDNPMQGHASYRQREGISQGERYTQHQEFSQAEKENLFLGKKKKNTRHKGREAVKKVSEVKEKQRFPVQESEKYKNLGDDSFLRVLFWQFHNFRMLLGSDLLIFSNEKYVAVSLHLWDVSRKVTPLTWLEAWLDNFMASVPELAICYHQDGVVQGYELLKTDDIFLSKGISDDGTPAFLPHVVQQNGLSVMRFLEENCEQDPGAYWLYKSAGEDVIQLFDLSVIPKTHTADSRHDSSGSLPSLIYRGRSDSILSLGTLLYRIAHRLSLSLSPNNRARCARFFQKCLSFLDEPDHLVVRALAHEQYARLLLTHNEDVEWTSAVLPVESEVTIADAEEESFEFISGLSASSVQDIVYPPIVAIEELEKAGCQQNFEQENSADTSFGQDISSPEMTGVVPDKAVANENLSNAGDNDFLVCNLPKNSDHVVQTVLDPISSKLAAIHHVSQAIKSLRWTRKLQTTSPEMNLESEIRDDLPSSMNFSVCTCGDPDCIEVCDIREWLPTSKIDDKLWKLVLLLGESYLALGQAYKDDGQLYQALKVVELACLVYGSMPQDTRFISSMVCSSLAQVEINDRSEKANSSPGADTFSFDGLSSNYLFWAKAWTLVGDVFVELYLMKGQEVSRQTERKDKDLKMSSEVLKEVERLKKKMEQFNQNCSSCSLINCSCQSDRASSGSSASSSSRDAHSSSYGRKQSKKSYGRNSLHSRAGDYDHDVSQKLDPKKDDAGSKEDIHSETTSKGKTAEKNGEARKAMSGLPARSEELQSVLKKKGWVTVWLKKSALSFSLSSYLHSTTPYYGTTILILFRIKLGSFENFIDIKKLSISFFQLLHHYNLGKKLGQYVCAFGDGVVPFILEFLSTNTELICHFLMCGNHGLTFQKVQRILWLCVHDNAFLELKQGLRRADIDNNGSIDYDTGTESEFKQVVGTFTDAGWASVFLSTGNTYFKIKETEARGDFCCCDVQIGIVSHLSRLIRVFSNVVKFDLRVFLCLTCKRKRQVTILYCSFATKHISCYLMFRHWREMHNFLPFSTHIQGPTVASASTEENIQHRREYIGYSWHWDVSYIQLLYLAQINT